MNERRVRFTATARKHVRNEKAWWLANRVHTEIFAGELEEAVRLVTLLPGVGSRYAETPVPGVRRVYLRKIACHLYYTFDEGEVVVHALWGARRGRGPQITS